MDGHNLFMLSLASDAFYVLWAVSITWVPLSQRFHNPLMEQHWLEMRYSNMWTIRVLSTFHSKMIRKEMIRFVIISAYTGNHVIHLCIQWNTILYTPTKSIPNLPVSSFNMFSQFNVTFCGEGSPLIPVSDDHTYMGGGSPTRTKAWETY